jgi:hypothetical protein
MVAVTVTWNPGDIEIDLKLKDLLIVSILLERRMNMIDLNMYVLEDGIS